MGQRTLVCPAILTLSQETLRLVTMHLGDSSLVCLHSFFIGEALLGLFPLGLMEWKQMLQSESDVPWPLSLVYVVMYRLFFSFSTIHTLIVTNLGLHFLLCLATVSFCPMNSHTYCTYNPILFNNVGNYGPRNIKLPVNYFLNVLHEYLYSFVRAPQTVLTFAFFAPCSVRCIHDTIPSGMLDLFN